jgi:Tol biopolymer transport system component
MALSPGQTIGPYRILRPLGSGGMGEVYRARDTRLGREVAIKALPEAFAADPERLARFEREARLLASVQHHHIATIYGVEQLGADRYLILELVEGETLAERLAAGPIPVAETVNVARQIASALETAHEKGIVHRDLKPGNVMINRDGEVKVLDFGLARGGEGASSDIDLSASPTVTAATQAGVILGTAPYMSPEQARGRSVDRRTDIWSFGCVLYECLSGAPPFGGDTVSDVMARILEREPEWGALPAGAPPKLMELLRRCLRKDPRERLRDMGDARIVLEEIARGDAGAAAPAAMTGVRRVRMGILAAAAVVAAACLVGGFWVARGRREAPRVRKFALRIPNLEAQFLAPPRISPDGRRVAYRAAGSLFVRDLSQFDAVPVNESKDGMQPFWSPDGKKLGFVRDGKIWVEDVPGGSPAPICRLPHPANVTGVSWSGGVIVFALYGDAAYQVPSVGGEPRPLLRPDPSEEDFHYLQFLPDGRHLVAVAHRKEGPSPVVVIGFPDGGRKNLRAFDNLEALAFAPNGYLLLQFVRSGSKVLAAPFSASKLDIAGEPFPVMPGGLSPTASDDGTLACVLGDFALQGELVWLDHGGHPTAAIGSARLGTTDPAISPDGKSALVAVFQNDNSNLWSIDLERGTWRPVTTGSQDDGAPVWSPDGSRFLFLRTRNVGWDIMEAPADGSTAPRRIGEGWSATWAPDGRSVIYTTNVDGKSLLQVRDLAEGSVARGVPGSSGNPEESARASPDGRWLAYQAREGQTWNVFVRRFADGRNPQRVSVESGDAPFWSRQGDALYYWKEDALLEVPVRGDGERLRIGEAKRLFAVDGIGLIDSSQFGHLPLDVAADGRFLVSRRATADPRIGLLVIEHWASEFERR